MLLLAHELANFFLGSKNGVSQTTALRIPFLVSIISWVPTSVCFVEIIASAIFFCSLGE
jgi:hypothetical protein